MLIKVDHQRKNMIQCGAFRRRQVTTSITRLLCRNIDSNRLALNGANFYRILDKGLPTNSAIRGSRPKRLGIFSEEFFCKVRVLKEVCLELQYPAAPLLESLEPLHDDYYWLLDVPLKISKALLLKFEGESKEKGFSVAV